MGNNKSATAKEKEEEKTTTREGTREGLIGCFKSVGKTVGETRKILEQAKEIIQTLEEDSGDEDEGFLPTSKTLLNVYSERLKTYAEAMMNTTKIRSQEEEEDDQNNDDCLIDEAMFKWFRSIDIVEAASVLATAQEFGILRILMKIYHQSLSGYLLHILECIPETVSPLLYFDILSIAFGKSPLKLDEIASKTIRNPRIFEERLGMIDSVDDKISPPSSLPFVPLIEDISSLAPEDYPPSLTRKMQWIEKRVLEIDEHTELVSYCFDLLKICVEKLEVTGLEELMNTVSQVCYIVYEQIPQQDITINEYLKLEDLEKLSLLTKGCNSNNIVSVLKGPALPIIERNNRAKGSNSPFIVEKLLCKVVDSSFDWILPIIKTQIIGKDSSLLPSLEASISTVISSISSCTRTDLWKMMSILIQTIPPRTQLSSDAIMLNSAYDKLESLKKCISMAELLSKNYGIEHNISFYIGIRLSKDNCFKLLTKISNSDSQWQDVLNVVNQIMQPTVSEQETLIIYFKGLLHSKRFTEAKALLPKIPEKDNPALTISQDFLNACQSANDPSFKFAKECLSLAPASKEKSFEEQLCDALQLLGNSAISANQLRKVFNSSDGPLEIAILILSSHRELIGDILSSVKKLFPTMSEEMERKIKVVVAKGSFEIPNYEVAIKYCLELSAVCDKDSWEISRNLLSTQSLTLEPQVKSNLLSHCISCCPNDQVKSFLRQWGECSTSVFSLPDLSNNHQLIQFALRLSGTEKLVSFSLLCQLTEEQIVRSFGEFNQTILSVIESNQEVKQLSSFITNFLSIRSCSKSGDELLSMITSDQTELQKKALLDESTEFKKEISGELKKISSVLTCMEVFHQLEGIPQNISIRKFCSEFEARRDCFCKLIQTTKDDQEISKLHELALSCGISNSDISIEIVCWSFSAENTGSLPEIQSIVGKHRQALLSNPSSSIKSLLDIFPKIPGTNHMRLGFFFTTLKQLLGASQQKQQQIDEPKTIPKHLLIERLSEHQKLLIRLGTISPSMDFSHLVSTSNPIEIINFNLRESNIHSIVKIIPEIIASRGGDSGNPILTASSVYLSCIKNCHLKIDSAIELNDRAKQISEKINLIKDFIRKMDPLDVIEAVHLVCNSETFVEPKVNLISFAIQEMKDKHVDEEIVQKLSTSNELFSEMFKQRSSLPEQFRLIFDSISIAKGIDRSNKFKSLCEQLIRNGFSCLSLFKLCSCLEWPLKNEEIIKIFESLFMSSLSEKLPFQPLLSSVLISLSTKPHPNESVSVNEDNFISECIGCILNKAKVFISNENITLLTRTTLLEQLIQSFGRPILVKNDMKTSPNGMKINSIVLRMWRGNLRKAITIPDSDIELYPSSEKAFDFLKELISIGVSPDQLHSLGEILSLWQDSIQEKQKASSYFSPCWLILFISMLHAGMTQDAINLRKRYNKVEIMVEEDEEKLLKETTGQITAAFALSSPNEKINHQFDTRETTSSTSVSTTTTNSCGGQIVICRHHSSVVATNKSANEFEVYYSALSTPSKTPKDLDVSFMAKIAKEHQFETEQERDSSMEQIIRLTSETYKSPIHASALLASFRSFSSLLRSTSAALPVLSTLKQTITNYESK